MAKCGCKKAKAVECEECPEWIFTFADLVMLMMGFFVILWVLKPPAGKPQQETLDPKWLEVVAKIREAFKYVPDPTSKDPIDMYMLMKKIEQLQLPLKSPGEGGETKIRRQGAEGTDPEVTTVRQGTQAIVGGRLLFDRPLTGRSRAKRDPVTHFGAVGELHHLLDQRLAAVIGGVGLAATISWIGFSLLRSSCSSRSGSRNISVRRLYVGTRRANPMVSTSGSNAVAIQPNSPSGAPRSSHERCSRARTSSTSTPAVVTGSTTGDPR